MPALSAISSQDAMPPSQPFTAGLSPSSSSALTHLLAFLALSLIWLAAAGMPEGNAVQLENWAQAAAEKKNGTANDDDDRAPLGSALLELASNLLAEHGREKRRPVQRKRSRQFFGSSNGLAEDGGEQQQQDSAAAFSRLPKSREQQEAELEDEIRAFVRVSMRHDPELAVRFRKKTFKTMLSASPSSSFSSARIFPKFIQQAILRLAFFLLSVAAKNSAAATMPRPFECFSCMSASYQPKWAFLKETYFAPKAFTDACDASITQRSPIPTVLCASFCVSMLEPSVEAGVFVGFKYIRGCGDRILRHGFNQTALQIHRFAQVDKCRQLPRAHLFNQPRQLETAITGNLQLCTCYGERCNGSSSALTTANCLLWQFLLVFLSLALARLWLGP